MCFFPRAAKTEAAQSLLSKLHHATTQNAVTFVLQVAFCIKGPTDEDKNSEWENKQLNLRYS
jgi:hypothetical protein